LVEHRVGGNVVEQVIDHVQLGEMIGIVDGREAQGRQVHPGGLEGHSSAASHSSYEVLSF